MSPKVPCKSKGQHLFSLLVFIGCSSGCNSGLGWASSLLWCLLILLWMTSHKGYWSLYVQYDLLHTGVHLLWLWEFWVGISAWWLCWTCWHNPTVLFHSPMYKTLSMNLLWLIAVLISVVTGRSSAVGIETRLRAGRSGTRIPLEERYFSSFFP